MWLSVLLGCVGIVVCAIASQQIAATLWRAYLVGYLSWWAIAMGGAGLLAIGNLTGGRWAEAARPYYLAAMRTLPAMAVLFVPLAFGLRHIYPWAEPETAEHFGFTPGKAAYLSETFFFVRAAACFVVWLIVAWWLAHVSQFNRRPAGQSRMRRAGALSLVLLVPTTTFAAFDWAMSLEPLWYSSIYGAIITAGGVVGVQALAIVSIALLPPAMRAPRPTLHDDVTFHPDENPVYGDLGNLQLAFVMVWTYFSFSQFLIIWYGNLPSEITWYQRRLGDGWQYVAAATLFFCFVVPFATLLSRDRKRSIRQLAILGIIQLLAYGLNMYWTLVPAFPTVGTAEHVAYISGIIAFGGLWLALYFFGLDRLFARALHHRADATALT